MNREPLQAPASPTLTIDTESDPGAWATAIAHTPHLAAQLRTGDDQDETPAVRIWSFTGKRKRKGVRP